jgi:hypothetical protein
MTMAMYTETFYGSPSNWTATPATMPIGAVRSANGIVTDTQHPRGSEAPCHVRRWLEAPAGTVRFRSGRR